MWLTERERLQTWPWFWGYFPYRMTSRQSQQAGGCSHQPLMVYPVYWSPRTSSIVCWKFSIFNRKLRGCFIFFFHSYLGKWSKMTNIFQMGWSHQLENICWVCLIWWPSTQLARSAKEVVCFVFFLNVWRTIYGNSSKMTCTQRYCKYPKSMKGFQFIQMLWCHHVSYCVMSRIADRSEKIVILLSIARTVGSSWPHTFCISLLRCI